MSEQLTTPKQGNQESIKFHDCNKYFPFRVMERITQEKKDETIKENHKFYVILGDSKVSNKEFKSLKSIETYIMGKPYELIINLVCDVYEKIIKDETTK